jgi:hypothetical protein
MQNDGYWHCAIIIRHVRLAVDVFFAPKKASDVRGENNSILPDSFRE